MKTALIHEWLVAEGGAEKVLNTISELFPSPIYTLVHDKKLFPDKEIRSSFIQHFPRATKWYRHYLPFFPLAIEQFDLSEFDCVISHSHAVAKGVLTQPHQLHLCYCMTPMRYIWDLTQFYLQGMNRFSRAMAKICFHSLRKWDVVSAHRVDHFIAISSYIAQRVYKVYRREAEVIYPPVATHLFRPAAKKEEFYLTVSRLVPYKRIDMIVEAFALLPKKKLIVIGEGSEMRKIKAKATANIEILGYQNQKYVKEMMGKARAFIFAALEDFGVVPVEAQAAGTPVIAFGKGGALETIVSKETGLFFYEQTVASLVDAVIEFEQMLDCFVPEKIKQNAERFSEERFKKEFQTLVHRKYNQHMLKR
jgi:glycosyltransferase involved in cell wall biosynthesis